MKIPLIPQDKANHFTYACAVYLVASAAAWRFHIPTHPRTVGLAAAIVASVAWEGLNYISNKRAAARGESPPHTVEVADAAAGAAGGIVCFFAACFG